MKDLLMCFYSQNIRKYNRGEIMINNIRFLLIKKKKKDFYESIL